MHDRRKGVDRFALQQDVDLDQVSSLFPGRLIVQAGITPGTRLEGIEEIENDLSQRQGVANLNSIFGQIVHAVLNSATILTKLENAADVACRSQNRGLDHRLIHLRDLASDRIFRRIGYLDFGAVFHDPPVDHVRRGGDQIKIKLPLQTFPDDLHVQQAKEADPESEPESARGFWLVSQRSGVELELVQGFPEFRIVSTVDRIEA